MGAPSVHLLEDLFTYTDTAAQTYVTDVAAAVAGAFQNTAYTLLMVYVILWGWSMLRGMIQEPVMDGLSRILKVTFVVAFATNSALYSSDVANFLFNWPSALGGVVVGGAAPSTSSLLDHVAGQGIDLATQAWQAASFANLGAYIISGILWVVTGVVLAISATIIIAAKLELAIGLAIGPIFILMLMFDATRSRFDSWLSSMLASGFTIVLVAAAATLMFKLLGAAFDSAAASAGGAGGVVSLTDITPAAIYGLVSAFLILRMPGYASGITGGSSMASATALGWAYDKIKKPFERRPQEQRGNNQGNQNGRFGRGKSNGISGSNSRSSGAPQAIYRKITSRKAA